MSNYLGFKPTENANYYFVSYNSEDTERVGDIAAAMTSEGIDLWYDYGIEYGDKWETTITEKIQKSDAVLLFFTKGILQKETSYVQKEYKIADDFFEKKIYVIMLDKIAKLDVPVSKIAWWIDINEHQCIQGYDFADTAALVDEIRRSLGIQKNSERIADPAESYMKYGEYYMNNDPKYARESYRLAIDIYEDCDKKTRERFLPNLATANLNIGRLYINERRYEDAQSYSENAIKYYCKLASQDPEAFDAFKAKSYLDMCIVYAGIKEYPKAISMATEAINVYEHLCIENIELYGNELSEAHFRLSELYGRKLDLESKAAELYKSIGILEQLAEIKYGVYEEALARNYTALCLCLLESGDAEGSAQTCGSVIHIFEQLCEIAPESYKPRFAHTLWELGGAYQKAYRKELTRELYLKSLEIYEELGKENPSRYTSCINGLHASLNHLDMDTSRRQI